MNAFERTEWNIRQRQQGFWMWPPQRLFEHHLSNADHYFYGRGLACVDTPVERRENTVMLDEMTLDHIVQGCVDVKNDLLKLQYFLQQENDHDSLQDLMPSSPTTPERQESEPVPKTEDLLREIQQLKEEAKKKDETIQHLENQLQTRCTCQGPKGEKPAQRTKYTQTSRRRNTSGYSSPACSPWQGSYQGGPRTGPPHCRQTSNTTVFQQHPQFYRPQLGKISNTFTYRGPK